MITDQNIQILIQRGTSLLNQPRIHKEFSKKKEANKLLNDIENHSHHFILGCAMNRQMSTERAWEIPFKIGLDIGGQSFDKFAAVSQEEIGQLFTLKKLHRHHRKMGVIFYNIIQSIKNKYNGDASKIWSNTPKSATTIRRFLQFDGFGIKIATMAANILVRSFKVPMEDRSCIDISPDVLVKRVFKRLGYINDVVTNYEIIYCARELYPEYPGIFDMPAWEIGNQWCKKSAPICNDCPLNKFCPKVF